MELIIISLFVYKLISIALKRIKFIYILFVLPGTIFHELAHFIFAVFLNAKPVGFSLIPKQLENGNYQLGSVSISNARFYNIFLVAIAPLFNILIAYILIKNIDINNDLILSNFIFSYIIFSLLNQSIPSSVDILMIIYNPSSFLFISIILVFICYNFNIYEIIKGLI